ncbi:MAG TPA: ABC transporter substrate-binding protein [Xanthobacteraceae bacterium]|jgi:NitT/TauT family transport system substrate-binding protein
MTLMLRRFIAAPTALAILSMTAALPEIGAARELLLAEPIHHVGFLPIYLARHKGYFKDEGIELKTAVMPSGGFINATLAGDAFAYIASVDHNAFARANGKSLIAVSNLLGHANIYMMARTDIPPMTGDLPSYLRGKRIGVSSYGGTPNNVLRYFLKKWNLDARKDVTLIEVANSSVVPATIKAKQADLGVSSEPFITQLYKQGLWTQPIFNAGKELGPFVDTAMSVRGDMIEKDPATVKSFVKAVVRALIYTDTHRDEMLGFAKAEFPTASEEDLKASLDRAFADGIFSPDGIITPESWTTGETIVLEAGILKQHVPYDEVIDMRFVNQVLNELKVR